MVAITLQEKEAIVKKYPDVHVVRTMKQDSKRHHYFCVEDRRVKRMLRELRGEDAPQDSNKKRKRKR